MTVAMFERDTTCFCGHTAGQHRVEWTGTGLGHTRCKANRCRCQLMEPAEVVDGSAVVAPKAPAEPPEAPVTAVASVPEVVDEPALVPAEPEPAPAAVEEPSPEPAEPDPAAVAPEPAAETDGQRVDRVTAAVLLAQPGPVATFGARWCPTCKHLGQPDGHTPGCSGRLERVTLAVLLDPR